MKLPAGSPPRWLLTCQRFLQWGGVWGGTLVLTAVATAFSAVYSSLLIYWFEPKTFQQMILVGLVVPVMLTPPIGFTVMTLIHALSDAHKTVQLMADRDVLTDAFTRRYFLTKAQERLNPGDLNTPSDSVVLLDVDNFKRINDQYGHPTGDAVLRAISETCRGGLRSKDIFARYGGEEFALLVLDATPQQALAVVERIRLAIHEIRVTAPNGEIVTVSASFGIASSVLPETVVERSGNHLVERILAAADKALYEAKHRGKDRAMLACDLKDAYA